LLKILNIPQHLQVIIYFTLKIKAEQKSEPISRGIRINKLVILEVQL